MLKYFIVPVLCAVAFFLTGCGADYVFKEYRKIDAKGWDYSDKIDFSFDISDTSKVYNLLLEVAHADTFANENAYVKVFTTFPDGRKTEQQLSLELASKSGVWYGKCSSGTCRLLIGLQENVIFALPGAYKVSFEQYGRTNPLKALNEIGLLVEDTGLHKGHAAEVKNKKKKKPAQ